MIRQQQEESIFLPVSLENQTAKMYEAHPTPGVTRMASVGQFVAQAPHSMQALKSTIMTFFSSTSRIW